MFSAIEGQMQVHFRPGDELTHFPVNHLLRWLLISLFHFDSLCLLPC